MLATPPQAPRYVFNDTAGYAILVCNGEVFACTDWACRSSISYFLYTGKGFRGRSLIEGGVKLGYKARRGWEAAVSTSNMTRVPIVTLKK